MLSVNSVRIILSSKILVIWYESKTSVVSVNYSWIVTIVQQIITAGSTSFNIILLVLFVFQLFSLEFRTQEIRQGYWNFFCTLYTLSFLTMERWSRKKQGWWGVVWSCHDERSSPSGRDWDIMPTSKPSQTDFYHISVQSWQEREWKQDSSCTVPHTTVQFNTQIQRSNTRLSALARTHSCTHIAMASGSLTTSGAVLKWKATRCYAWRSPNGNTTVDLWIWSFTCCFVSYNVTSSTEWREGLKQSVIKAVS